VKGVRFKRWNKSRASSWNTVILSVNIHKKRAFRNQNDLHAVMQVGDTLHIAVLCRGEQVRDMLIAEQDIWVHLIHHANFCLCIVAWLASKSNQAML